MIIKGKKKGEITFVCDAAPGAKKVCLAGSFNDWDPNAKRMTKSSKDGTYRAKMQLEPGQHEYKFVIDGQWVADTNGAASAVNEHGTLNNIVVVE